MDAPETNPTDAQTIAALAARVVALEASVETLLAAKREADGEWDAFADQTIAHRNADFARLGLGPPVR